MPKPKLSWYQRRALHLLAVHGRVQSVTSIDFDAECQVSGYTTSWLGRQDYAKKTRTSTGTFFVATQKGRDAAFQQAWDRDEDFTRPPQPAPQQSVDEFRRMLNDLDATFHGIQDPAGEQRYFELRDEVLAYVDEHPDIREQARTYGLPV